MSSTFASSTLGVCRGTMRVPPTWRYRNHTEPKRWARSNKGCPWFNMDRGVGLLGGQVNKFGKFHFSAESKEYINLQIPDLTDFELKPYVHKKVSKKL